LIVECFECGAPAAHQHHVIPRSRGGTKTVPLCLDCHDLVHDRTDSAGALIRAGRLRAKIGAESAPIETPVVASPIGTPAEAAPQPVNAEITESDRRTVKECQHPVGWTAQDQANLRVKIRNRRRF
jgi:hypothetical protein